MKRLFSGVLALIMLIPLFSVGAFAADEVTMPVEVSAKSAVLMDVSTGKLLAAHEKDKQLYPASVTKIMPLLLFMEAIENGKMALSDTVTAGPVAVSKGGSQIWLKEGETMTVDELLKAVAIYSANDACTAMGEHLAGSDEAFVGMLNERADQLGMKNTHFDNCTGLDDTTETHLTTAYDVALMSVQLLRHDLITKYTTVWMDSLRNGATELVNTNKLVRFYNGCTGLKTGTTSKAGCCVSASAEREGTHLVAVVMGSGNSDDRFNSAKALLNWGFANYTTVTPKIDETLITDVAVINGFIEKIKPVVPQTASVLVKKGSEGKITQSVEIALDAEAPIEQGQTLGKVVFSLDGETLGEYTLTAPDAVPKLTFFEVLKRLVRSAAEFKIGTGKK